MNDRITVFLNIVLPALLLFAIALIVFALLFRVISAARARARRAASRRNLMSVAMPPEVRRMADELWDDTQPASWTESHLVEDLWRNCPDLRPHLISLARQWEGVSPTAKSRLVTRTGSGAPDFAGVSASAFEPKDRLPPFGVEPGFCLVLGNVSRRMPEDDLSTSSSEPNDA